MNSHRDNMKDAIFTVLDSNGIPADDLKYVLADAVFDALGITEDEQDMNGGYFMLHAGERYEPKTIAYDETGEFNSTVLTSQAKKPDYIPMEVDEGEDMENQYAKRTKELEEGAKYSSSEFKAYAVGRRVQETGGWYVTLQTPICKYGQAYDKDIVLEEAKTNFVNHYYMLYVDDYERSTGKVD